MAYAAQKTAGITTHAVPATTGPAQDDPNDEVHGVHAPEGGEWVLVLDGKESEIYDRVGGSAWPDFTGDGRVVCQVRKGSS